ncbi:MAG: helicase-related protein, partial [Pirellulales bacterium]
IPRTLAHSLYGDLDISEIRQQPAGRQPIRTYHILPDNLPQWWDFFGKKLRDGRLGYVVVPVIEDSERGLQSIASAYEQLANGPLEAFRLGLVHGNMPSKLQNSTLSAFRSGKIDVLVATPVIEVGIDIPQATLMTILDADCFGLAQLHQLRGRVARGSVPGICGVATEELSERVGVRIEAFVNCDNGFDLAALDHQLRGSGRLFGAEQSGHSGSEFKFKQKEPHTPSSHSDDTSIIPFEENEIIGEAHQYALSIMADDPSLSLPKHARLKELVELRRKEQSARGTNLGSVG